MTSDQPDPVSSSGDAGTKAGDLPLRAATGIVLAALALVLNWYGGVPFAVFWTLAAVAVLWEWSRLVAASPNRLGWTAVGIVYAAVVAVGPILLRSDAAYGLLAVYFLFAIVWATDIAAYFVGRFIGGPKLWPAVSPKKTWSGAVAGVIGAVAAGSVLVAAVGGISVLPVALLAALLSVVSQFGDLFESRLKRLFGVKDSSQLIPGHGGAMDRLDGFVAAAAVAILVGISRGGLAQPGQGLLIW